MFSWISEINYSSKHEHFRDQQVHGTGQWFWDHAQYNMWRSSELSTILLLHGIPGCGKTVLTSALVEKLREERRRSLYQGPIAHFYCRDDENEERLRNPHEILCNIVKQLAKGDPQARDILMAEYQRRRTICDQEGSELTRPRASDCEYIIREMTRVTGITIVIDGLDEVKDTDRPELLEVLLNIRSNSKSVAKIFATSRDHRQVLSFLSEAIQIRIQSHDNRDDLENFTRLKVSRLLKEMYSIILRKISNMSLRCLLPKQARCKLFIIAITESCV